MNPEQTTVERSEGGGVACEARPRLAGARLWGSIALGALLVLWALHVIGALAPVEQAIVGRLPDRPADALQRVVDVFTCCVLNWRALTTMLPAFVLAGAIAAFVPPTLILRYLGAGARRATAYGSAALAGCVLSLCSCNVVPLFMSIYRRGAGIGPAFAFLFSGPALNVVATVFTIQVIGWRVGVWRSMGVPLIAIAAGIVMSLLFRREERLRQEEHARVRSMQVAAGTAGFGRVAAMLGLLLAAVVFGAWEMPWAAKATILGTLGLAVGLLAAWGFEREELGAWARETWGLVKLVIPVLIPAILVIGAIAAYLDIKIVYRLVGPPGEGAGFMDTLRPILLADLFGALMYFPILSEVAFAKAFLKLGMDVGPALAILLTGPGLSLPGLIILGRAIGWRKALAYQATVLVLTTALAYVFSTEIGEYICECMMLGH